MSYSKRNQGSHVIFASIILLELLHGVMGGGMEQI
jgi:hypothetical protein